MPKTLKQKIADGDLKPRATSYELKRLERIAERRRAIEHGEITTQAPSNLIPLKPLVIPRLENNYMTALHSDSFLTLAFRFAGGIRRLANIGKFISLREAPAEVALSAEYTQGKCRLKRHFRYTTMNGDPLTQEFQTDEIELYTKGKTPSKVELIRAFAIWSRAAVKNEKGTFIPELCPNAVLINTETRAPSEW